MLNKNNIEATKLMVSTSAIMFSIIFVITIAIINFDSSNLLQSKYIRASLSFDSMLFFFVIMFGISILQDPISKQNFKFYLIINIFWTLGFTILFVYILGSLIGLISI